jgi:uncharacterized protein (TIGR02466 family)
MDVLGIFATPIAKHDNLLSEQACLEILTKIRTLPYYKPPYTSTSFRSEDRNVLRLFPDVKAVIEMLFLDFARSTLGVKPTCDFTIMSSWATMTVPGGDSTKHSHCNSYWSGVLYLTDDASPILFHREKRATIVLDVETITEYSSNEVAHTPSMGQVVFFPSHLSHQVSRNRTEEDRFSIAFNILPDGLFGLHDSTANISVLELP